MKKRILSMALIVAMVVAMIPAVLVNAFAAPYSGYGNGYDVYVSETEPTLDGQMDAVYENSEMVPGTVIVRPGIGGLKAYALATASGLFVYAEVKDSTVDIATEQAFGNPKSGDKFQFYIQVSNGTNYAMNYFDMDYAHEITADSKKGTVKPSFTADGWAVEFYMPWSDWGIDLNSSNAKLWFGIQANDGATNGCLTDNPATSGYWTGYSCSGTTAPSKYMIKANLTTTAYTAANDLKYTSFVTNETITLDGKRDDIYLASEKITAGHVAVGTVGETTGFETYMVAREDGLYVFASMYDNTLDKADAAANGLRIQDGDKFQIYLQLGNNVWKRWGYIDFDYVDGGRHIITSNDTSYPFAYSVDEVKQKAVLWEDGKGWDIEIFIPHSISTDNRLNPAKGIKNPSFNDLLCRVNFQALNETCTAWNASGTCTERNRYGLSYDIVAAENAWNGPNYTGNYYVPVEFSLNPVSQNGIGAITYAPSVSIDGTKDAAYGDDSVAFYINKEVANSCQTHASKAEAKAWVTITDTKIAVYAEIYDETAVADSSTANDDIRMFVYWPITGTINYLGYGYVTNRGHIATTSGWGSTNPAYSTNGEVSTGKYGSIGETYKRISLGNNKYVLEMAFDVPAAERYAISQGETIDIGFALRHYDCCGDAGTTACATSRTCYEYNYTSTSYASNNLPKYEVSKNSTVANFAAVKTSAITGANVALGESITVNYYANVPAYSDNVSMKFTMNGKVTFVPGVATNAAGTEYKFAFEGLAPQCMGDIIDAELYVAGKKVAEHKGYSVLTNVNNVKNDSNKALVEALLNYGAAAQQYAHYKTDSLVNAGLTAPTYAETLTNNQKSVGTSTISGAKFSAAGVYHANTNKIYAKITVNSVNLVDKLTVTINGVAAEIEKYSDGIYIVYSDDISVKNFDQTYEFVLTGESGSQTLTYSVNAYAAVKWNAENANTKALARAMYAYGAAAENYNG